MKYSEIIREIDNIFDYFRFHNKNLTKTTAVMQSSTCVTSAASMSASRPEAASLFARQHAGATVA